MLSDVELVEPFFDAIYRLDFDAALEFFEGIDQALAGGDEPAA